MRHYGMVPSVRLSVPFRPIIPEQKVTETLKLVKILSLRTSLKTAFRAERLKVAVTQSAGG